MFQSSWRRKPCPDRSTSYGDNRDGRLRVAFEPGWILLLLIPLIFLFSLPLVAANPDATSTLPLVPDDANTTSSSLLKLAQANPEGLTRQQGDAILEELRSIRQLLQQQNKSKTGSNTRKRPTSAKIALSNQQTLGQADAPVTMVEFTDYQCPYCKRFHDATFPKLREKYIDTGKLRYVAMDLPLRFHKQARPAAIAAHCAAEQDRFWQMRELLFKNSRALGQDALLSYAADLSLDVALFGQCIDDKKHDREVQRDMNIARGAGFTGTPSFVIGKSMSGEVDGVALIGAKPLAEFENHIQRLLGKKASGG